MIKNILIFRLFKYKNKLKKQKSKRNWLTKQDAKKEKFSNTFVLLVL